MTFCIGLIIQRVNLFKAKKVLKLGILMPKPLKIKFAILCLYQVKSIIKFSLKIY